VAQETGPAITVNPPTPAEAITRVTIPSLTPLGPSTKVNENLQISGPSDAHGTSIAADIRGSLAQVAAVRPCVQGDCEGYPWSWQASQEEQEAPIQPGTEQAGYDARVAASRQHFRQGEPADRAARCESAGIEEEQGYQGDEQEGVRGDWSVFVQRWLVRCSFRFGLAQWLLGDWCAAARLRPGCTDGIVCIGSRLISVFRTIVYLAIGLCC
jgi:hypothetical protein